VPRDWQAVVNESSNVMKLVHLAARYDVVDEGQIRADLLTQGRAAYQDELTVQAATVGCPGRTGQLSNGPILSELNDIYIQHAASIVSTYNYDLAMQIAHVREETPRANRHTYAARLRDWDTNRASFKQPQIAQMTEAVARALAQQHFHQHNGQTGVAVLEPTVAVCPVCIGWIARGEVPLPVALNSPPPYHINCPHYWNTQPQQRSAESCELLWMGE